MMAAGGARSAQRTLRQDPEPVGSAVRTNARGLKLPNLEIGLLRPEPVGKDLFNTVGAGRGKDRLRQAGFTNGVDAGKMIIGLQLTRRLGDQAWTVPQDAADGRPRVEDGETPTRPRSPGWYCHLSRWVPRIRR